jgi:hypothetical protein
VQRRQELQPVGVGAARLDGEDQQDRAGRRLWTAAAALTGVSYL